MKLPTIKGVIKRRILLNYRADSEVVASLLPSGFRPKLVKGYAIAGICLIRLEQIRPAKVPAAMGISSENSAHRIAVEWDTDNGETNEGVYIPQRHTDSKLNAVAGGRLFPGVHHLSSFEVTDQAGHIHLRVQESGNPAPLVDIEADETDAFPKDSVFQSLAESSAFFEAGSIGYSPDVDPEILDGLKLQVPNWVVSPLAVNRAESSFFDDESLFPKGSIELDHALLMRDIDHEWHSLGAFDPK